ncbi:hypothetical protein Ocin01_16991 [Orchesella cincta]|uniref:Uncharacterized protein n=1 Tax=Orchesella cincta TaxID=48709 RepID=A0A1D2M9S5_ORCCI|nr:hypothetical protein Ocin01_16991 [Orchesella cincta]
MNSVRFHCAQFAENFLNTFSDFKISAVSCCHSMFKDSRKRAKIFAQFNLFISSFNLLLFCVKHKYGIKHPTTELYYLTFLAVVFLQWIIAIGLGRAYRERSSIHCQIWCLIETLVTVGYLFITLLPLVYLALPGIITLVTSTLIKMYGIWIIYYFSLGCASKSAWKEETKSKRSSSPKEPFVTFASKKRPVSPRPPPINRKDTDQTSIESNPQSPLSFEADSALSSPRFIFTNEGEQNQDEHRIQFFGNEDANPQYSEIMMRARASNELDVCTTFPHDNIVISDLMCGGTSNINPK